MIRSQRPPGSCNALRWSALCKLLHPERGAARGGPSAGFSVRRLLADFGGNWRRKRLQNLRAGTDFGTALFPHCSPSSLWTLGSAFDQADTSGQTCKRSISRSTNRLRYSVAIAECITVAVALVAMEASSSSWAARLRRYSRSEWNPFAFTTSPQGHFIPAKPCRSFACDPIVTWWHWPRKLISAFHPKLTLGERRPSIRPRLYRQSLSPRPRLPNCCKPGDSH